MADAEQLTLVADVERILRSPRPLPPGYAVRALTDDDEPELAALYFNAYDRSTVATATDAEHEFRITYEGEYGVLDPAASPVVLHDGAIACAAMTVEQGPWDDVPSGPFLIEMMTAPAHRRRGLAAFALQEAARTSRGRTLALRVMSDNPAALALYRGLGFDAYRR